MIEFSALLRTIPLFHGVPEEALAILNSDMITALTDSDYMVRQGDNPRFLFVVLDGTVEISAGPSPATRVYIDSRRQGDIIGEQAFIEGMDHSADVRARGWVRALRMPAAVVEQLLKHPRFARNMLTIESSKLRAATKQRYAILAENRLLFSHFRSHVDQRVVDALLNTGEDYGKPRYIDPGYVMFTDLRDFTQLSVNMDELEIASQLAPYLSCLVEHVHRAFGIVDKYIGDAVMAVWGHPALGPVDANKILDACIEMVKDSARLAYGGKPVRIGIGLNAGRLFMGNVGNEEKRAFTVLGGAVNLAARYESANKGSDGQVYAITVGPQILERLDQHHRELLHQRENVEIKGAPGDRQTVYSLLPD